MTFQTCSGPWPTPLYFYICEQAFPGHRGPSRRSPQAAASLTKTRTMLMKELLERYEQKPPEIVFHWNDPETEAEG